MAAKWMTTNKISEMPDAPTVLGVAQCDYEGALFPEVEFERGSSGVQFKRTQATYASATPGVLLLEGGRMYLIGSGTFFPLLNPIKPVYEVDAFAAKRMIQIACGPKGTHQVMNAPQVLPDRVLFEAYLRLEKKTAAEVKAREQEHLDDFEMAFSLTGDTVAKKINGLSAQVFASEEEAMRKLMSQLDGKLVPQYPLDLASWKPRLREVAHQLAYLSMKRDKVTMEHSPEGFDISFTWDDFAKLVFKPRMKTFSTPTNDLIKLADIDAAKWDGTSLRPPGAVALTSGQLGAVKSPTQVKVYKQRGLSGWMFDGSGDTVSPGLKCRIEEVTGNSVWVSVTASQCKAAGTKTWNAFEQYFEEDPKPPKVWFEMPSNAVGPG